MGFLRQTWTLTEKNLLIVFSRHWLSTSIRAFIAPIVFMFFISYAKNFFVPPSNYGVGSPTPLRSLTDALHSAGGGRNTIALINNGHTGGDIENLINQIAGTARAAGANVEILSQERELSSVCRSSLRGVTSCYAAASFHSSPSEGGLWNYTLRADGTFGRTIFVNRSDNDAQIYVLPLQHAIDATIAGLSGSTLPDDVEEFPFTTRSNAERQRNITRLYMGTLINILAVAYFVGVVGVTYQLTGQMAAERELGMSQLIESMMPNKKRWQSQAARLLSYHLAFDIIYSPGWIIMGAIASGITFPESNAGIVVVYHILAGLALTSWSIAFASLFRKAQLSGITVVLVSIVLAIIVQVTDIRGTAAVAVLSLLFPPMNYVFFIIYMAYWQQQTRAADISKSAPNAPWQFPGYVFWIFLVIQAVVFPFIGAFIERSLYGTASKSRRIHHEGLDSHAVELSGFSKHYKPGWWNRNVIARLGGKAKETVIAVDNLNLAVMKGQIVVLLGANGSGKSTTLDAIAGLGPPSEGLIDIDGTGGLGLCPQKNVLWDVLTVYEHVKLFNRLKTTTKPDSKEQIKALIKGCDLEPKTQAKSKTLSGGQKRKLQLAMMFTGGSKVCCVDEVSSGIDPLSRRKIWDILLAERGSRSILLTTHFLDEADLLSDFITILSRGKLMAEGSAEELKHKLGGGYRVHIYHDVRFTPPKDWDMVPKQILYDQTVYQLADSGEAARFVTRLEQEGVLNYRVNGPTIEDVFLKLAEEVKGELQAQGQQTELTPFKSNASGRDESKIEAPDPEREMKSDDNGPHLLPGQNISLPRQTWILFRKRFTVLRRNYLPYCATFLIPVIAAALVTLFIRGFDAISCSPEDRTEVSTINSFTAFPIRNVPVGPPDAVTGRQLADLNPFLNANATHSVSTLDEFTGFIDSRYGSITPGGFFLAQNGQPPVFAYIGNFEMYASVWTQNVLDSFLLDEPIVTNYGEFDSPWAPNVGNTLQFILYFGLAMCAYPGFFALYPTVERLRNVRALHYSNGVRAGPLWLAYTSFDFLFVVLISAIAIIIFVSQSDAFYYPGYLFVVFFLYGLAAILTSYVISLFAASQLAAFAFAAGGQCSFFLIYFISYMSILTYSDAASVDSRVNIAHFTIALITPSGNLLRALLLTWNQFGLLCRGRSFVSYPGDITVYGGPILYLIVQSALLLGFLVWWDSGWKPAFLVRRNAHRVEDIEEVEGVDPEVYAEASRVATSNDGLRVLHVTKAFGSNVAVQDVSFGVRSGEVFALLGPNGAGKSTTIGLVRGDMRPTDHRGDILVEDISIIKNRAAARHHLGVCPQFDAMDTMTVLEHLRFYARVRGVPDVEHNVAEVVEAVGLGPFKYRMAAKLSGGNKRKLSLGIALMGNPSVLLLDEPSSGMDAASKRVMWRTLSAVTSGRSLVLTTHSMEEADALAHRAGIMARKMLALGTADSLRRKHGDAYHVHLVHKEAPHTSNDEMARVKQWLKRNIPGAVTEDRTFHGQLRFSVPNASRDPDAGLRSDEKETASTSSFSSNTDVSSSIKRSPGAHGGIAALFALLEAHKNELGFEYYSVSQTTLDEVFLSIVGKHNVQEENYASQHQSKAGVWAKIKKGLSNAYHNA